MLRLVNARNREGGRRCSGRVSRAAVALAVVCATAATYVHAGSASDVWRKLHRPLHLPRLAAGATCPVSPVDRRLDWKPINIFGVSGIGPGPVYPGLGGTGGHVTVSADTQYGGPWLGGKLFWYVRPTYRGPILIRGRRLDANGLMGFDGARRPEPELRIHTYDTVSWSGQPAGSRGVPSSVRVLQPGCYAAQIDGTRFSRVVVFIVID
jgi:hypothetical protein